MSYIKTPLRYPGGKQRLWKFVYEILRENKLLGGDYIEPYAGGAGVAMELLLGGHVSKIHLNDSCPAIYAFWHSILNETDRFCQKISRASLNVEEWKKQREIFRNRDKADRFDLGFATFYLNRCNRSGILNAGVIGGLAQEGNWKIDARFNRNSLISRIEAISTKKRKIRLRNWDAERFLKLYVPRLPAKSLIYCDPPYFKKADRLYPNYYTESDHSRIAKIIQREVTLPWIVSYDACDEIIENYVSSQKIQYSLQYSAGKAHKGSELFIFSKDIIKPNSSQIASLDRALKIAV